MVVKPAASALAWARRDHLVGHVDADDAALGADQARGQQQVDAGAGAQVEDDVAGPQARHRERVAAAERVDDGVVGQGGELLGGVAGELDYGALAGVGGGGVLRRAAAAAALCRSAAAAAPSGRRRHGHAFAVGPGDFFADLLGGIGVGGRAHGVVLSSGGRDGQQASSASARSRRICATAPVCTLHQTSLPCFSQLMTPASRSTARWRETTERSMPLPSARWPTVHGRPSPARRANSESRRGSESALKSRGESRSCRPAQHAPGGGCGLGAGRRLGAGLSILAYLHHDASIDSSRPPSTRAGRRGCLPARVDATASICESPGHSVRANTQKPRATTPPTQPRRSACASIVRRSDPASETREPLTDEDPPRIHPARSSRSSPRPSWPPRSPAPQAPRRRRPPCVRAATAGQRRAR